MTEPINEWVCRCGALIPMTGTPGNPDGKLDACPTCGKDHTHWCWNFASGALVDELATHMWDKARAISWPYDP